MKRITVNYSLHSVAFEFPAHFSAGQVIRDPRVKTELGYGDNVTIMMNGVAIGFDTHIDDGDVISVETAANRKAKRSGIQFVKPLGVPQHI